MKDLEKTFILNTIFHWLREEDCIVFLFGSRAKKVALKSSDIDIGIFAHREIPAAAFVEIEEILNQETPMLKKIDLVDFSSVDQKVKKEALKEIEIWHVGKNCSDLLKTLKQASKN
ncbi:MAG: hypothetical protein A3I05_09830 [Deltaproteobacteria bacterium RIFCSPLOWO2_02_FULL_44_10]|nr:MAG: hypothetical protein A3C46_09355 [Deltaproteobacteria bacterium RIFCSPHIGHO2_02_FULL_44_16]OGQ44993.1 MAG: hypothetical protein A3I05_09830 [Deltaproteobacteria bacterium RIFCSPLOWO2_02_FULL_44_10]